jgi:hypothetical protein
MDFQARFKGKISHMTKEGIQILHQEDDSAKLEN